MNRRKRKMHFHRMMVACLHRRHYPPFDRPLRPWPPRNLLDQVTALCRYHGIEPVITRELLDAACAAYFIDSTNHAPPSPSRKVVARSLQFH